MKMIYNGTPINSMKVKHYEMDTNDCDMIASDLQAGKTAVARGKKITGTGKSFEFAYYGQLYTNVGAPVPSVVNIVEIASLDYPVRASVALNNMKNLDFSSPQSIGSIIVDGISYPISVVVSNGKIIASCDKTIKLQIFYGKDNYT